MALRPLDAVAEGAANSASSPAISSTTPAHALQASNLHRHLRTNNYSMVRKHLLSHPPPSNGQQANHTLLVSNRIGWSALHFAAASHGSLMLRERQRARAAAASATGNVNNANANTVGETVAEEAVDVGVDNHNNHGHAHAGGGHLLHHHMANQPVPLDQFGFAIPQNDANNNQEQADNGVEEEEDQPEGGWWRWLLLQIAEAVEMSSASSISRARGSPFLARTEAGMTPTDLFFCGHVRPLPWQRPEIHEAARWLRRDMANVCGDNGLISIDNASRLQHRLRQRIERERRVEWHRQRKEKANKNDDDVDQFEQENDELVLEEVPWDDSILDALVVFWHAMELLLMAAYHGTMDLDEINDTDGFDDFDGSDNNCKKWRVVHALAYTGCPPEVAKLAVCLYPEQVRERDENHDLPLHVAVRSRSSSSQWDAAEDDAHAVADIESLAGNIGDGREVDSITGQVVRQSTLSYTPACAPVIKALLDSYPHAAACADGNGRLPLNLALVSGRTWRSGIADILEACPDALFGTRDTATHLAPFMLAAVDQRELREHSHQVSDEGVAYEEPDEAELRAKKIASNQIGGMWRFMSHETKEKVLAKVRQDIAIIKFETIFEILRAMPDAVQTGNPTTAEDGNIVSCDNLDMNIR